MSIQRVSSETKMEHCNQIMSEESSAYFIFPFVKKQNQNHPPTKIKNFCLKSALKSVDQCLHNQYTQSSSMLKEINVKHHLKQSPSTNAQAP